ALRAKPGETFDYWEIWEKAEAARRILRSRRYLEAVVEVATSPRENGGLGVEYKIRVGPKVSFVFPEDQPGGSLKKDLENAWTGEASDSFLATDLANLATRRLFQDGYFTATAELTTERTEQELLVKLFLHRGQKGEKVSVEFEGNESVPDSFLLEPLPKPRSGLFHDLLTTKRSQLKQIVALQYASLGFVAATIGDPETAFDDGTRTFQVTIPVTEGARFFLRAIELEGVAPEDEAELRSKLSLRAGAPFRVQSFAQDRAAVAAFYRERGYVDVDVEAALSEPSASNELDVRFAVTPGARVTVADVVVSGNKLTRESVIRREVKFEPGAPLSPSTLRETERGLYELGVFQSAEAVVEEPAEGTGGESRAVRISVVETQDLEFNYGARASTDGFFEVLTELRAPNLFGRAQHASVRALVGSERKIFRFSYHSPYLARYRLDTDFFVERSLERQGTEPFDFTDHIWTFTAQQTRPLTEKIDAQWSYTFRHLLTQFGEDFEGLSRKRSIVTGSLIGDHRDNMLIPRRGSLWLLTTQLAPEFLGSDLRYTKIFGQFFLYLPIGEDLVWASGYRVGAANSFGQRLDENDGFRAGGPNSVRGFEQDTLGPSDIVGTRGGGGVAVFNQEIRFPLWWRFRGVAFYDTGNAFETASDLSFSDLRQSAGAGLRFELPFGLVRLDWAAVINPLPGETPWRLLFSLGDAF
ncbi:MAG TPA: BamA/TamA family outer membrane protein, partial [Vicinamibacteria bacterium]|nr:BamA/TamA family outer membrane protein [Vicinamibacteria bacterium]